MKVGRKNVEVLGDKESRELHIKGFVLRVRPLSNACQRAFGAFSLLH
jgi:hypothetical protein